MSKITKKRILFVCLGNICRSPTAEGVFQALLKKKKLEHLIETDSAGTGGWHIGSPPDQRAVEAAKKRGYDLSVLRGRQFCEQDFECFDYILAMDRNNLNDMLALEPANHKAKLDLFLNYAVQSEYDEVPDPYYGGDQGFELVLDLIEQASENLLEEIVMAAQN